MGKVLIIKGADFSTNATDVISFDDDTLVMKKSQAGVFFLDYQGSTEIQETKTAPVSTKSKVFVWDVRQYVGRSVKITSANPIVTNANYDCFASDLGTLSFTDIPSLSSANAQSGSGGNTHYPITVISVFNVSSTQNVKGTVTKIIPSGAKYLVVTARFDNGLLESEVKAELL